MAGLEQTVQGPRQIGGGLRRAVAACTAGLWVTQFLPPFHAQSTAPHWPARRRRRKRCCPGARREWKEFLCVESCAPNPKLSFPVSSCYHWGWRFCPGGTFDNSPAFQRRDRAVVRTSPAGTTDKGGNNQVFIRPFGTMPPGRLNPALKRRAMVRSPFGTGGTLRLGASLRARRRGKPERFRASRRLAGDCEPYRHVLW